MVFIVGMGSRSTAEGHEIGTQRLLVITSGVGCSVRECHWYKNNEFHKCTMCQENTMSNIHISVLLTYFNRFDLLNIPMHEVFHQITNKETKKPWLVWLSGLSADL